MYQAWTVSQVLLGHRRSNCAQTQASGPGHLPATCPVPQLVTHTGMLSRLSSRQGAKVLGWPLLQAWTAFRPSAENLNQPCSPLDERALNVSPPPDVALQKAFSLFAEWSPYLQSSKILARGCPSRFKRTFSKSYSEEGSEGPEDAGQEGCGCCESPFPLALASSSRFP